MEDNHVQKLSSKPAMLKEWGDYQTEGIVSRKIIQKPAGSVTFFAFDEGQELTEHTAPFDALVYVMDGEAQISIAGKPSLVRDGQIFMMPGHQPHALKALKKFKMLLTMIKA